MARGAGGRKQANKSSTPAATDPTTTAPTTSTIPAPFKVVGPALEPFVSTLPTDHVFLVHIDRTPIPLKRRVFVVPVLLNILITIILCIRVYYAAPVYVEQLITIFGYDTAYKVDTERSSTAELLNTVASRTILLLTDYTIFVLLGSWPKEFVFGSRASRSISPFDWRTALGFQEEEIIVRRGRIWDKSLLEGVEDGERAWTPQDELILKNKVEPAMRKSYTSKTGYLLLDKHWDLDFRGIIDAHRLVKDDRIKQAELQDLSLVYYNKQWIVWKVHENLEPAEVVKDEKVEAFKNKMTELGHEDVFFRWIEMVQYETSRTGGFTQARQDAALQDLKNVLESKGLALDDIGGSAVLPGLT